MMEEIKKRPRGWLSLEDCEGIFNRFRKIITFDQPIPLFESREPGKLEGILGSVRQTFDGKYLNPTVLDATSAYFPCLELSISSRNSVLVSNDIINRGEK